MIDRSRGIKKLLVRGDSELVLKQVDRTYRLEAENLLPLHRRAVIEKGMFDHVDFEHVRRGDNVEADMLATVAVDSIFGFTTCFESEITVVCYDQMPLVPPQQKTRSADVPEVKKPRIDPPGQYIYANIMLDGVLIEEGPVNTRGEFETDLQTYGIVEFDKACVSAASSYLKRRFNLWISAKDFQLSEFEQGWGPGKGFHMHQYISDSDVSVPEELHGRYQQPDQA